VKDYLPHCCYSSDCWAVVRCLDFTSLAELNRLTCFFYNDRIRNSCTVAYLHKYLLPSNGQQTFFSHHQVLHQNVFFAWIVFFWSFEISKVFLITQVTLEVGDPPPQTKSDPPPTQPLTTVAPVSGFISRVCFNVSCCSILQCHKVDGKQIGDSTYPS